MKVVIRKQCIQRLDREQCEMIHQMCDSLTIAWSVPSMPRRIFLSPFSCSTVLAISLFSMYFRNLLISVLCITGGYKGWEQLWYIPCTLVHSLYRECPIIGEVRGSEKPADDRTRRYLDQMDQRLLTHARNFQPDAHVLITWVRGQEAALTSQL